MRGINYVDLGVHERIRIEHSDLVQIALPRVEREHVIKVMLVQHVATTMSFKEMAHKAIVSTTRIDVIQDAKAANKIPGVGIVFDVADDALWLAIWGINVKNRRVSPT